MDLALFQIYNGINGTLIKCHRMGQPSKQTAWSHCDHQVIGVLPNVKGHTLTGLRGRDFHSEGQLEASPNVVFLRLSNSDSWHRLFIDGPQLYCQRVSQPDSFNIPEAEIEMPLRDLGLELGLLGQPLASLHVGLSDGLPSLSLNFVGGQQVTFCASSTGADSWGTFELAIWHMTQ